ncbi:L-fucose mutarotase [Salinibacillus kushneri]|uniref:L-fucose mutarotase n=1 Tax=Salinibacillus kushneri TaxID=237682 RepID=A0A1H9Z1Y5_9BACI|nr:RbsD/FucU domain-containing protein [Salinibacillus kushneri]SES75514.1 L-fucose mutarotase [Salinibacillus kushneri]
MLKGIPKVISPDLMKALLSMGHGDEIVLADGNFPAETYSQRVVRADGHQTLDLLNGIMKFFPLDTYSTHAVSLMQVVEGDNVKPTIWEEYLSVIQKYEPQFKKFQFLDRYDFYERSKQAFAVVSSGEEALYANMIIKKGVVTDDGIGNR